MTTPAQPQPRRTLVCPDCAHRATLPVHSFHVELQLGNPIQFLECPVCSVGSPLRDWNVATQAKGAAA